MDWLRNIFNWTPKNYRHFGLIPVNGSTAFDPLASYAKKLNMIFSSPAMLKVVALQCGMFSLGRFYVYDNNGQTLLNDPFNNFIRRPNIFQYQQQFLWEYMFWKMIGSSYVYIDRNDFESISGFQTVMQNLDPSKITLPKNLEKLKDKIITSRSTESEILNSEVTYTYEDGKAYKFPYKKIMFVPDIPFSGDHFSSRSKIDALYKIIANSEATLDSLNINIRYAGKFMVAGTQDPNDVSRLPLSETEKQDIEKKINDNKPVTAVKSMIDIKRFVENAGNQKLSDIYLSQYFLIGSMFNIPKDVLEAFNSGTYENQEKARGAHVAYSIQPDGDLLATALSDRFGYTEKELSIEMDWEHLPFMQVFAEQRAKAKYTQAQTLGMLLKNRVTVDSANAFLDTEFEFEKDEEETGQETDSGSGEAVEGAEAQIDESVNNEEK